MTQIARSLQLTAYDAACLALAARHGLEMATLDDGLKSACRVAGVKLVE